MPGRAYQRGLWHLSKANAKDNALAEKFFQQAIDLDPTFAGGHQAAPGVGSNPRGRRFCGHAVSANAGAVTAKHWRAGRSNSTMVPTLRPVHAFGKYAWIRGDHDGARAETERSLALSPEPSRRARGTRRSDPGMVRSAEGGDAACFETCLRLDPRDPLLPSRSLVPRGTFPLFVPRIRGVNRGSLTLNGYGQTPDYPTYLSLARGRIRSAWSERRKQKRGWTKRYRRSCRVHSTCMSATACPGCDRRTTPTCSKGCGRPAGRVDHLGPISP